VTTPEDRQAAVLAALRAGGVVRSTTLALTLGVASKTVQRDIACLVARGYKIESRNSRGYTLVGEQVGLVLDRPVYDRVLGQLDVPTRAEVEAARMAGERTTMEETDTE
jgi:biotin operon repressor